MEDRLLAERQGEETDLRLKGRAVPRCSAGALARACLGDLFRASVLRSWPVGWGGLDPLSHSFSPAACKESKRPLEVSQRSEEMGLILGICAGGLAVLILLLGAIIVIIRKG